MEDDMGHRGEGRREGREDKDEGEEGRFN